ncbi:DsbA family protein [Shewanella canadensis]|uniref:DsbA family protein n=1 Tax=Shewanella canadensis TaxID=271096 RepID=A0A431WWN8_9GAMM|nr:DsbA family protein [Shewanella canadensis]RTR39896.1 DsbA family protein [Shewanella canadensis]
MKVLSSFNRVTDMLFQSRKAKFAMLATVAGSVFFLSSQLMMSQLAHADHSSFTDEQKLEIRAIVEDALVNDPELLKEAIIALQMREEDQMSQARGSLVELHHAGLFETQTDPWKGAENPAITMVYFTDFNCPYCKKLEPSLDKLIEDYPQLRVITKMVPLQGEGSQKAVELAQKVWLNEPDKYLALKDMLMSSPRRLDTDAIAKVAKLTDTEQWLTKSDDRVVKVVRDNVSLMRDLGLSGTPSMIFGDTVIPGLVTYEVLKEQLEEVIQAKG